MHVLLNPFFRQERHLPCEFWVSEPSFAISVPEVGAIYESYRSVPSSRSSFPIRVPLLQPSDTRNEVITQVPILLRNQLTYSQSRGSFGTESFFLRLGFLNFSIKPHAPIQPILLSPPASTYATPSHTNSPSEIKLGHHGLDIGRRTPCTRQHRHVCNPPVAKSQGSP